jgi:hypothetical protein
VLEEGREKSAGTGLVRGDLSVADDARSTLSTALLAQNPFKPWRNRTVLTCCRDAFEEVPCKTVTNHTKGLSIELCGIYQRDRRNLRCSPSRPSLDIFYVS